VTGSVDLVKPGDPQLAGVLPRRLLAQLRLDMTAKRKRAEQVETELRILLAVKAEQNLKH
jgi:hypothetical protein